MRKFISIILIIATMLTLFACSKVDEKGDVTTDNPSTTTSADTTDSTTNPSDTTETDSSVNDTSKPETTKPVTTKPSTTAPPETDSSVNDTSKPETTKPVTTKPSTTAPPETEPPITGTIVKFNIGIGTVASGAYRFAAYDISEKKLYELEQNERAARNAAYPGHYVIYDPETYVVSKSEGGGAGVDLVCSKYYGAAVVFTAGASGSATVVAKVTKLWGNESEVDVVLMTGNGEVLAEQKNVKSARVVVSFKETVELTKGNTVFLLVKYSSGNKVESGQNCILNTFEVYFDEHSVKDNTTKPSVTDDSISYWATHSYDKVIINAPKDTGSAKFTVNMAKQETEGCQLVVMNDGASGRKRGKLVLLSNPQHSIQPEIFVLQHYEDWNGNKYTDACTPYFGSYVSIAAKTPLPFLVEFTTLASTPAGDYNYTFAFVNDSGKTIALFEVTVHVWNITIPLEKTFRAAAGLDTWYVSVMENVSDDDLHEVTCDYYSFLLKHNISASRIPVNVLSDSANAYLNNPIITFVEVPCKGSDGKLLPDEEILKYYKKLKQNPDWLKKAVFYPFDEPDSEADIKAYNEMCEHLRTLCPDIPVFAPFYTNIRIGLSGDQVGAMYDDSGIWCPKLCLWDDSNSYKDLLVKPKKSFAERMNEKAAAGAELWTYVCNAPGDPYAQFFLDTEGRVQRLLFWQIYQRDIKGFFYWRVNKWASANNYSDFIDPWKTLNNGYKDENGTPICGEGAILYPGKAVGVDGPVASLRLKYFRDGIDDIELLLLAKKHLGEDWVKEKTNGATDSLTTYTDNDSFAKIRKEIGDALESKMNK